MITTLAYRNVLENVCADMPGKTTEKWQSFVNRLMDRAKKSKLPEKHPFITFDNYEIDKKYDLGHLKEMAKGLYSALSETIHNFRPSRDFVKYTSTYGQSDSKDEFDQYTPIPGQWGPMQIDFLSAMRPCTHNHDGSGDPDWIKERNRYVGLSREDLQEDMKQASEKAALEEAAKKAAEQAAKATKEVDGSKADEKSDAESEAEDSSRADDDSESDDDSTNDGWLATQ